MFKLFREAGRSGHWYVAAFDTSGLQLASSSPLSQDLLRRFLPRLQDQSGSPLAAINP
ncbi:MAG TPA: hypothetical protein VLK82_03740 [Candidatus Tectomicrobia bacterium]|nr:hypothetical protein [Candidatus Tectomicrobia bacterium]